MLQAMQGTAQGPTQSACWVPASSQVWLVLTWLPVLQLTRQPSPCYARSKHKQSAADVPAASVPDCVVYHQCPSASMLCKLCVVHSTSPCTAPATAEAPGYALF
jgi:hypothetical protein